MARRHVWIALVLVVACTPDPVEGEPASPGAGKPKDGHPSTSVTQGGAAVTTSGDTSDTSDTQETGDAEGTIDASGTQGESGTQGGTTGDGGTEGTDSSDDGDIDPIGPVDPVVFPVYSASFMPGETHAFAELMHFSEAWDMQDCPSECAGNTAPKIGAPVFWINGAWAPGPPEIVVGDRVGILLPFADAECNLGCGLSGYDVEMPYGARVGLGSTGSNIPCDTNSSNVFLGLDFVEVEDPGEYIVHIARLRDGCYSEGSTSLAFTVQPNQP